MLEYEICSPYVGVPMQGKQVSFDKLKLPDGRSLVIDSLEGQIQLNAFRAFLGPAFQSQLEVSAPA